MTAAFQPLRPDGKSRAALIFDHVVSSKQPGDVMDYGELAGVLDVDSLIDRGVIQQAVRGASRKLRRKAHRSIQVVRNQGYRVLLANEHVQQAKSYQSRAQRSTKESLAVVRGADVTALLPEERKLRDSVEMLTSTMVEAFHRVDQTLRRQAEHIAHLSDRQNETDDRMRNLETGLRAAGISVPEPVIEVEAVEDEPIEVGPADIEEEGDAEQEPG